MAKKLFQTDNRAFGKAVCEVMVEYHISSSALMKSCRMGHTCYGHIKKAS